MAEAGCTPQAAQQLVACLQAQAAATDGLPHRWRLVIERCPMPGGTGEFAIIHAQWGRQLLRPLGLALQVLWRRRHGGELGQEAGDDCLRDER